jgi:uncharacterized repeat protein (TIGR01451 family)
MFTKSRSFGDVSSLLKIAVLQRFARVVMTRIGFLVAASLFALTAAAAASAGTVNGTLFLDFNVDGVKQAEETGLGGLTVNLKTPGPNGMPFDFDDLTIATATTDGVGNYSFTGVPAGTYYVNFDRSPFANNFLFSPKDQGSDDTLDSDADPTTGNTPIFSLGAAATVTRDVGWVSIRTRSVSGANAAAIQSTVDSFRNDLGTLNPNVAGSALGGGRREINWDGVPAPFAAPNSFPPDFFNVNSPRGVVFSTPGTGFQVSGATGDSGAGQPAAARFGNIQPTYTANFQTFSPQRLFTAIGSNVTDVNFFLAGSATPGFSSGFGAVFTDVERANATSIEFFNQNGASLGKQFVPTSPGGGLTFFGISFSNARDRVLTRVRITTGEAALGAVEGANDLVVMDDFIYGEPVPNANLVLTVSDSPDPVVAGANITYTLTLSNVGTADAQNVSLTDDIPSATTFVSMNQTAGPGFAITGPSVGGTGTVTATGAALAAGATATFTLVVRVNSDAFGGGGISNFLGVVSNPPDILSIDNGAILGTSVITRADMAVSKVGPAAAVAGTNVSYAVAVTNGGPSDAQAVDLSDTIPAGMTFVSMAQNTGPAFSLTTPAVGGTGTAHATITTMAAGASATFTLVAKVNPAAAIGSTIVNTATIATTTTDPGAANNLSSTSLTVLPPTMSINDVTVTEGNSGSTNATFTVTLSSAIGTTVSVDFFTANGSAVQPGDFTAVNGTLNFAPGQVTRTITVPVNGDTLSESNETFFVNLSNPTNTDIADGQGLGTITDDDSPTTPTLSINDVAVTEGDSGSTNAAFTVTLSIASSSTVSVDFFTSNGSSAEPGDYTAGNGTVSFAPGQTTRTINVAVNGDTSPEPNETFFVNLANPSNADIADGQGIGTINDDDASGVIQFGSATASVSESAGAVTINVTRTGNTAGVASVTFETSDLTAQQKRDYTFGFGVVLFGPGETTKAVKIPLVNDALVEGPETLRVTLSNSSGNFVIGNPGTATITINDDDSVPTSINPIDDPAFFVRQQYLDFLGREPDPAGLAFWVNNITSCGANPACIEFKRIETSAAFFLSIEFQETAGNVARTQRVAFGRQSVDPLTRDSYLEFMRDTRQIGAGVIIGQSGAETLLDQNKQNYAQQVVNTPGFLARFPIAPATAYVDALFASAGVAPTTAERNAAIAAFGAGGNGGRTAALRSVTDSNSVRNAEFRSLFVLSEFFGYLRRNPTDAPDFNDGGFQFWLNKLNTFNGDFQAAEMVKAFLASAEYRQRFGTP